MGSDLEVVLVMALVMALGGVVVLAEDRVYLLEQNSKRIKVP